MEKEPSQIDVIFRRLGPVSVLAVIAALLPILGTVTLVSVIYYFGAALKHLALTWVPAYIGSVTVLCGLAVLSTNILSILGGWSFGFAWGLAATSSAMTLAAILAYFLARWISGQRVLSLLKEHPKWQAVYKTLLDSGFFKTLGIVFLIRVPSHPFAITNLVLASTRVNPLAYLLGTFLGILPRTAVEVWIGSGLTRLSFDNPAQTWIFIGSIVVAIAILAVIGHLANRAIQNITNSNSSQSPPAA